MTQKFEILVDVASTAEVLALIRSGAPTKDAGSGTSYLQKNLTSESNPESSASTNIMGVVGGAAGGAIFFGAVFYALRRAMHQVDNLKVNVEMLTAGSFVPNLSRSKELAH